MRERSASSGSRRSRSWYGLRTASRARNRPPSVAEPRLRTWRGRTGGTRTKRVCGSRGLACPSRGRLRRSWTASMSGVKSSTATIMADALWLARCASPHPFRWTSPLRCIAAALRYQDGLQGPDERHRRHPRHPRRGGSAWPLVARGSKVAAGKRSPDGGKQGEGVIASSSAPLRLPRISALSLHSRQPRLQVKPLAGRLVSLLVLPARRPLRSDAGDCPFSVSPLFSSKPSTPLRLRPGLVPWAAMMQMLALKDCRCFACQIH